MSGVDATHDAGLESWLDSANDPATDFPIQNLPFGRFRSEDDADWRIGVAIGDQVLDVRAAGLVDLSDMNRLIRLAPEARAALRAALSEGLRKGDDGFGEGNFKALFQSIERDQVRRGVLEAS